MKQDKRDTQHKEKSTILEVRFDYSREDDTQDFYTDNTQTEGCIITCKVCTTGSAGRDRIGHGTFSYCFLQHRHKDTFYIILWKTFISMQLRPTHKHAHLKKK